MKLEGKRVGILLEDVYEDMEFWYPYYRLKEEGAEISVIAPERATYESKHGLPAEADIEVAEVEASDLDALVIPGGYSPDRMRRHPAMVKLVRDVDQNKKPIAAICHAGWMLVSARILDGRSVTGFFSIKDDLVNAGATWEDKSVVRDGNLVTSRHPGDLPDFCRTLIEAIAEQ